ncbi:MAG TPA: hypothetical protein VLW53_24160 [Candidatus Eisenbacteria bacterium]|nr:hypothetical protein [Candidatus Eisenbacteria bacterium]
MSDLDRLLERWAERSRLTGAQSEAILAAVVRTPEPALDPAWWQDLVGRVSGMIVQVTTMPEAARAAMLPPLAS